MLTREIKFQKTTPNAFVGALGSKDARTENDALSNSTSGSKLVDQFAKAGAYRGRDINTVWAEQGAIWGENPLNSVKFIAYLRLVTRKIKGFITTDKVQNGQGARDEAFKRLLWVAKYHPDTFYKNLWLIPVLGSWKDVFELMELDMTLETDCLKRQKFFELIAKGIADADYNKALVQKYMPAIKAKSKTKTLKAEMSNKIAKELAAYLGLSQVSYRKFKATGIAHNFQRVITGGLYDQINWNEIPGKALFNLVKGKFIEKHNLTASYEAWLDKQPIAKFTGYVHELGHQVGKEPRMSKIKKNTYDKQFLSLIETAKKNEGGIKGNVWVAADTSGSMGSGSMVKGYAPIEICLSMSIFFAELNVGAFHNHLIMFDSTSKVAHLTGDSFVDKYRGIQQNAMGSTNFQSVIDEIVRIRKTNPHIPISDYPETIIVITDMQFDPVGRSYYGSTQYTNQYNRFTGQMERIPVNTTSVVNEKTNYEMAMSKLKAVGLPPVKIIWWDCVGRGKDVPATVKDSGTMMVSGFDGSVITLILGGEQKIKDEVTGVVREKTMEEKIQDALNQEVISQIVI